jgi:hypothetical protein
MFDPSSRYAGVEPATITTTDEGGRPRVVVYARRRFIPDPSGEVVLAEHVVVEGDRLDWITAIYLGDPLQFWRVADANGAMRPEDLTAEPGQTVRITIANG